MQRFLNIFFLSFFVLLVGCKNLSITEKNNLCVVSYNVENLFDTEDDSLTIDEDFTPQGSYRWTPSKLRFKMNQLSKVICNLNEGKPPMLIGLYEVENRNVLEQFVRQSLLKKWNYQIVHQESTDRRGIDVALLYQPLQFSLISEQFIRVEKSRDILYAKGMLKNKDTLHVFLVHNKSRRGSAIVSESQRMKVMNLVRQRVDSLFALSTPQNIIIMGDMNDTPMNKSLTESLKALDLSNLETQINARELYNLMDSSLKSYGGIGTYKFQQRWDLLDQFIVSGNLLKGKNKTQVIGQRAYIYSPDYLFVKDNRTGADRLIFRTNSGFSYVGGFSDHLPIYLYLTK